MKKIILLLTFLIVSISGYSQLTRDTVYAGQYAIRTMGTTDYISNKAATAYTVTYMAGVTSVSVVDTVFYVPGGATFDTLSNFVRPVGLKSAIVFERGNTWTETVVITQDTVVYGSYSGDNGGVLPIIAGYINTIENSSVVIKNLTVTEALSAIITNDGFYLITNDGYVIIEN